MSGPEDTAGHERWPQRAPEWRHDAPDPPEAFQVPWSWRDGLALIAIVLLAIVVISSFVAALGLDARSDVVLLGFSIASEVVVLTAALAYLRARGALTWHLLGPLRPRNRHILVGLAVGAAGWVVVMLVLQIVVTSVDPERLPQQEALQRVAGGGVTTVVMAVAAAVVLAPVVEELIYRAVLFQALRGRVGLYPAMGISSFVWGFTHLELLVDESGQFQASGLLGVLALVLLGFWLAGAFHRTGSLVVPVAAHAVFNAIALAVAVVAGPSLTSGAV
ncbi:MAG: CPBP family intramembrane metalloprotease [Actinobacteria bacterium]|nr:CPBP family intramembrane metalloprotease [Actinomycetota bacterium]